MHVEHSNSMNGRGDCHNTGCDDARDWTVSGPLQDWGLRLSDALRTALKEPDFAAARKLALEGDGQARSLAKEYTFMIRGLGITIGVLLRLLDGLASRNTGDADPAPADELADLLHRFRTDLAALQGCPTEPQQNLACELALVERVLEEGRTKFEREQAMLADEIVKAIVQGDAADALAAVDAKETGQYLPLHDCLVRFMADSFGWVLRRYGPDELLRFHLETAEGQRSGFEKWEDLPVAEFARISAFLLKQHMGHVVVTEDDEKYTIKQTPCGSGGRLLLEGAYSAADGLPFVETPCALTFGKLRLPVYCSHCAIWNGTATLRWFGHAQWVFEDPARNDGSCKLHIYKRPGDIPKEYAERVGASEGGT